MIDLWEANIQSMGLSIQLITDMFPIQYMLKTIPNDKVLIFKKQKDLNKWLKNFTNNDNILDNIR